jgi:acyl-CoA thioesterase
VVAGPSDPEHPSDEAAATRIDEAAFDRETAIVAVEPGRWRARLDPAWNIGATPNGGYALAPLVQAMATLGEHPDPVSLTAHFLRPCRADRAADLSARLERAGRRMTTVAGSLAQDGSTRLTASAVLSELPQPDAPGRLDGIDVEPPELAPPDRCTDRADLAQGVDDIALLSRVDVRVDTGFPERSGATGSSLAGWIRFADGRAPDAGTLPLFVDCFPPSLMSRDGATGWVPTVELTVHVRRRPVEGWIQGLFTVADLIDDLAVEDGWLWDAAGRLVARSRQLALYRRS